jgi:hypothetical protein
MKKTTEARVSGTLDPLVRARIEADKAWNAVADRRGNVDKQPEIESNTKKGELK